MHHADHLGDHVAGTAHDHGVADAHVLARDLVEVVQRGIGDGDAADEHRREPRDRLAVARPPVGTEQATRLIVQVLQATYCGSIGVEFMHIQDPVQKAWIQERIEGIRNQTDFTKEGKKAILTALKTYGMLLADNGSNWYLSGAPDERWNNDRLVSELRQVAGRNFEVVRMDGLVQP